MRLCYPAVFTKKSSGKVEVSFPDIKGCGLVADSFDSALSEATEELREALLVDIEEGSELPPVSDLEDIALAKDQEARQIAVILRLYEGWDE